MPMPTLKARLEHEKPGSPSRAILPDNSCFEWHWCCLRVFRVTQADRLFGVPAHAFSSVEDAIEWLRPLMTQNFGIANSETAVIRAQSAFSR